MMRDYVLGVVGALVPVGLFVFISWKERKVNPHEIQKTLQDKLKYLGWLNCCRIADPDIEEGKERIREEIEGLEKRYVDYYAERPR